MADNCGSCTGVTSAITDVSGSLVNGFKGTKYSPVLNQLMDALDNVEIKMRMDKSNYCWSPGQFPQVITPYNQRPSGTEVVFKHTKLFFDDNRPYRREILPPGAEGGICAEVDLCAEPEAHQIPGDSFQKFNWSMYETAWETPTFCLKNLLYKENGFEVLSRYVARVEKIPFEYYDNYIRNEIWDIGEKYLLAPTKIGLLWNSPDRVTKRKSPNLLDFKAYAGSATADAGVPTLGGLAPRYNMIEMWMGDESSSLQIEGDRQFMLVSERSDFFSIFFNDTDCSPCSFVEGGMGFNPFSFSIVDKLPFAVKFDKMWFRGDFDEDTGEFYKVPQKVYVKENGGQSLHTNPDWLAADYGILTVMTANPFKHRRFGALPGLPAGLPDKIKRNLSPRFQFYPLETKCSWSRGEVAWRAEDEFALQPSGEKVIHIIFRRDSLGSYIREAKSSICVESPDECEIPIPVTCGDCSYGPCCCVGGLPGYEDSTYSIEVQGDLFGKLGIDPAALPAPAQIETYKGIFDVSILGTNSARTKVTFGVDPLQHDGAHKCCESQFVGFVVNPQAVQCVVGTPIGMCASTYDPTKFTGPISGALDAAVGDVVSIFFDTGCGQEGVYEATVDELTDRSITITFTDLETLFPKGVPCGSIRTICASATAGCEDCLPSAADPCVPDTVTPVPLAKSVAKVKKGKAEGLKQGDASSDAAPAKVTKPKKPVPAAQTTPAAKK